MRRIAQMMALILLASQVVGCASTRSAPERESADYTVDLGRTTSTAIDEVVPRTLRRYRYQIYRREERVSSLYIETEWEWRDPEPDEAELGYTTARTRIIIDARSSGRYWRVRLTAEHRLRRGGDAPWEEVPATEGFRQYVDRIAADLRAQLEAAYARD